MIPQDAITLELHTGHPHELAVEPALWSEDTCVVLVLDGIKDHRTPALTPHDARRVARMLLEAADSVDDGSWSMSPDSGPGLVVVPDLA